MIFDLTQCVQTFLHTHNKPPMGSFYDQMQQEKTKKNEELLQAQRLNHEKNAKRLSYEQETVRNEVLRRQQILRNEERGKREPRRSMSEQSPKHRANSSVELVDDELDRTSCHVGSDHLYFPLVGRKIRRGTCIGKFPNWIELFK